MCTWLPHGCHLLQGTWTWFTYNCRQPVSAHCLSPPIPYLLSFTAQVYSSQLRILATALSISPSLVIRHHPCEHLCLRSSWSDRLSLAGQSSTLTAMDSLPQQINTNAPLQGYAEEVNRRGLIAIVWTCYAISTMFMITRLAVRLALHRTIRIDDVWMIIAWLSLLTMCILQTIQQEALWYTANLFGGRVSKDDKTIPLLTDLARWQFPIITLFWTTLWCVKGSILAACYRFVQPFTTRRWLWYGVVAFTTLSYLACILTSVMSCSPPADYFRPGKCSSPSELYRQRFSLLFSTAMDVVSDFLIMAVPLSLLPRMNLNKKKKVALGAMFTLSLVIVSVSILRMTQVTTKGQVDIIGLAIWSTVETAVAVIIGSLPPLRTFLSRKMKQYAKSVGTQNTSEGEYTLEDSYALGSKSRTIMKAESIPLDEQHRSQQQQGRIYVQRMFETHIEHDPDHDLGAETDISSRQDDDELRIIRSETRPSL